jgi:hypothetical protein
MALFDPIVGAIFIGFWMTLGIVPWLVASILTRGSAGLALLPICMLAGAAGGMLVPFLGFTNVSGIWLSFLAAVALPGFLMAARRFANPALALDVASQEPGASRDRK